MSLSDTVVLWSSVTCVSYVCLLRNIVKTVTEIMSLHCLSHVPSHNRFQNLSQEVLSICIKVGLQRKCSLELVEDHFIGNTHCTLDN